MREPFVLERLFASYEAYSHILQQIFLHLDSYTLKSLLLASKDMNLLVKRVIWKNSRAKRILRKRLSERYFVPQLVYFLRFSTVVPKNLSTSGNWCKLGIIVMKGIFTKKDIYRIECRYCSA